ncbi:hypothetical protein ABZ835_20095 [Streptomyces sp. NPDC047461]|uniref:hypothetical protein n=1 Tax=Streptomyces sp. NPDC047461 TaxID=3155619 RepID=UPI0033F8DB94
MAAFAKTYSATVPKTVKKITDDVDKRPGLLRLPRRALDPPAHHETDCVGFRHFPAAGQITRALVAQLPLWPWSVSSSGPSSRRGGP